MISVGFSFLSLLPFFLSLLPAEYFLFVNFGFGKRGNPLYLLFSVKFLPAFTMRTLSLHLFLPIFLASLSPALLFPIDPQSQLQRGL